MKVEAQTKHIVEELQRRQLSIKEEQGKQFPKLTVKVLSVQLMQADEEAQVTQLFRKLLQVRQLLEYNTKILLLQEVQILMELQV